MMITDEKKKIELPLCRFQKRGRKKERSKMKSTKKFSTYKIRKDLLGGDN